MQSSFASFQTNHPPGPCVLVSGEAPQGFRRHYKELRQMEVEYRPTHNHPGYRVGDDGSVWSLWTMRGKGPGAGKGNHFRFIGTEWHQLTATIDRYGRPVLNLKCPDGSMKQRKVCQLVLEAFVGPRPDGMEACHFPDRNPANNRRDNLRWDTPTSNQADKIIHGTTNRGDRCGTAKLTADQVRTIISEYTTGRATSKELAELFGIHPVHVCRLARGERWKYSLEIEVT